MKMKKPIKVVLTGATGHIGYSLLFRIANGDMFGRDQPVEIALMGVFHSANSSRRGILMEIEDCAFPLLTKLTSTTDLNEGFKGANWVILLGALARKAGMQRSDLLEINGRMFVEQGVQIARQAADDARVLVVGNPCNTNAWIAMTSAGGKIPQDRWYALTRLDENRARHQLAQKAGVSAGEISNMTIWGNHSNTQYPDFYNAKISGKSAVDVINDEAWLKECFLKKVQNRGAEIIDARGASSAASAANAIIDTVFDLTRPTPQGHWNSVAVCSDGSYGIPEGLICSMPVRTEDGKTHNIVQGLDITDFSKEKMALSVAELIAERDCVLNLANASGE